MALNPLLRLLRFLPLAAIGLVLAGTSACVSESRGSEIGRSIEDGSSRRGVDSPFLWKVQGKNGPSYLFGTIHAGVSAAELPGQVNNALRCSDFFVMETAPPKNMNRAMSGAMDLDLAREARREGARILTLESLDFQLSLLSKLGSQEEIAAMLGDSSDGMELDAISAAYRSGDLQTLMSATGPMDAQTQEILLNSRNRKWVHQLSPLLARGGAFVAVGAGHMAGEQGLLELLQGQGFSVERV